MGTDVGENLVLEQLGEDRCTLCSARRAESATLTRESHEKLGAAPRANDAGETRFEESTIEVAGNGDIPEGPPEAVASLESFLPQALEGLEAGFEEEAVWIRLDRTTHSALFLAASRSDGAGQH